jgi:general secretion pathway protein B
MSFILDALKKSESDRQRQSGPALFEVKLAPPGTGLPSWAIAVGALLLVNLGVVMWMLLRHSTVRPEATPAAAAALSAPPRPEPATAVPAVATDYPPALLTTAPSTTAQPALTSLSAPAPATLPASPVAATGAGAAAPPPPNREDLAPASEPASPAMVSPHVRRGTADGVPLYQDAAAAADAHLPQLRLDLHVFAARTQDRFVMINMHKLREGDALPEGVRVESITPEGAVLSYKGSRFLLPR